MSGRQDKKERQFMRREFAKLDMSVDSMIRRPPRFFPAWLWYRLQRIFLKV